MSWKFNPPPGWPAQPEGWVPPPGWIPDPSWPPAPPGWQFWVPAGAGAPAAPTPTLAEPAPPFSATPGSPAYPPAAGSAFPPPAAGPQPFSAGPAPSPFGPTPAYGGGAPPGAPPPYGYPPAGGPAPAKPWFSTWWAILGLIALLLIGSAAGYGGTRLALAGSDGSEPDTPANTDPTIAAAPADPTGSPEPTLPALPTLPPLGTPDPGTVGDVCSEVGVILFTLALAPVEEADEDDYDAYVEVVVDARRTAADQLRDLEGEDAAQQDSLDTLADEIDGAAQQLEDDPYDRDNVDESFDRVIGAYEDFNNQHC